MTHSIWAATSSVPDVLTVRGAVRFDEPDADTIFETFRAWAQALRSGKHPSLQSINLEYSRLHRMLLDPPVVASRDIHRSTAPAWLDPARYDVSDALLRGFFSGDRNWVGDLGERTVNCCGAWEELCSKFEDEKGSFSCRRASAVMLSKGIDVALSSTGRYLHAGSLGGRHRVVALLLLGAPALPATLYTMAGDSLS